MKIGFDAKRAFQNNTGLGNYSRFVIDIISRFYEGNDYYLFAPKKTANTRLQNLLTRKNVHCRFAGSLWKLFASLWRTITIKKQLKKEQITVFHGLSNELPVGINQTGIRSVVTIHDLIFLRYPSYYAPIDRLIYRIKFRYACRVADQIIAISECTKRDIISYFHIPEEKIAVVYQGCHPNFKQPVSSAQQEEVVRKYALPAVFFLYVGTVEERKNLLLPVKALVHLPEDIHLVVVGKRTAYQKKVEHFISAHHLSQRVHFYPQALFDDLPAFYHLAQVFILPSRFEGFGIPVIESLSCGTPVIAAKGSCLEEAGGKHSIYIDPDNDLELADKIALIRRDTDLARRMSEEGRKYVERFSDEAIACEFMRVYHEFSTEAQ